MLRVSKLIASAECSKFGSYTSRRMKRTTGGLWTTSWNINRDKKSWKTTKEKEAHSQMKACFYWIEDSLFISATYFASWWLMIDEVWWLERHSRIFVGEPRRNFGQHPSIHLESLQNTTGRLPQQLYDQSFEAVTECQPTKTRVLWPL